MGSAAHTTANVYLNGLGPASIAAAMYLIRKADFNPGNIHIFAQMGEKTLVGGSFALLGQFVEIPDGIVFTTEYSVRGAMHAVKRFVKPSLKVPPMYFGQPNPLTSFAVARALLR